MVGMIWMSKDHVRHVRNSEKNKFWLQKWHMTAKYSGKTISPRAEVLREQRLDSLACVAAQKGAATGVRSTLFQMNILNNHDHSHFIISERWPAEIMKSWFSKNHSFQTITASRKEKVLGNPKNNPPRISNYTFVMTRGHGGLGLPCNAIPSYSVE